MPSIQDIIGIAKVSEYLVTAGIIRGGLYGSGIDLSHARKLYCIRKNIEYRYTQEDIGGGETPSAALVSVSNKLYSICYNVSLATAIYNSGNGGGSVTPVSPTVPVYPFIITSADFESDGVTYINPNIVGDNISLFVNQYSQQWLLAASDTFSLTDEGFVINIPGFDANSQNWTIMVQQIFGSGGSTQQYPYIFDSIFSNVFN